MGKLPVIAVLLLTFILSLTACSGTSGTGGSRAAGNVGTGGPKTTDSSGVAEPAETQRTTGNSNAAEHTGTQQTTKTPGVAEPADSQLPPKADAVLAGKIAQVSSGTCLLAGSGASDLYTVTTRLDIYGADGKAADSAALKAGQNVEVGYSGAIMESYPAQLGAPAYIRIIGQEDDLVGFYQTVLNDLWKVDEGLNSDIKVLAFDLSKVTNLTEAEKSALVYMVSGSHNLTGIKGTFSELRDQGYISKEKLSFETGLLFELKLTDTGEDSFTFDVEKWRGGDGAYYFNDCKAVRSGSGWSYTIGSQAIS